MPDMAGNSEVHALLRYGVGSFKDSTKSKEPFIFGASNVMSTR